MVRKRSQLDPGVNNVSFQFSPSSMNWRFKLQCHVLCCLIPRHFCPTHRSPNLSDIIYQHAAYHHGEQSLTMTVVNLAQDYVGSNNLNLLLPSGQYGSRNQGGKDHASARYIFTEPAPIPRTIFHPGDHPLLNYLKEDKDHIKPEWYMPVIAIFLILINGAEGIGTGLSRRFLPALR
jgi:hypothetical protein